MLFLIIFLLHIFDFCYTFAIKIKHLLSLIIFIKLIYSTSEIDITQDNAG